MILSSSSTSSSRHNAAKKFIYKLFIFIVIFKIVDLSLYKIGESYALNEAYSYGGLSRLYSGQINTSIVFFGSSRIYLHINPSIIEEKTGKTAYNLAKDGTNIEQALFTLEEYLIHNTRPDIVVFDADVMQLDNDKLLFQKEFFKKFQYFSNHTMDLFGYSYLKKLSIWLVPSQIFSNQGVGDLFNSVKSILPRKKEWYIDKKDFGSWIFIKGAHLKKYAETFKVNDKSLHFKSDENRKNVYSKLLLLQKRCHFLLILLETPMLSGLDNKTRKIGVDFFNNISSKNDNVFYISYFNDLDLLTDQSLWFNETHLNIFGANLLSAKLATDINDIIK